MVGHPVLHERFDFKNIVHLTIVTVVSIPVTCLLILLFLILLKRLHLDY